MSWEVFFSHLKTTGEFHMLNDTPFFGLKIFCHGIGGNQVGEDAGLHSLAKSVEQESSSVVQPGLRRSVEVVVLETNRSCLKRKGKGRIHSLMPYGFFSSFFFLFWSFLGNHCGKIWKMGWNHEELSHQEGKKVVRREASDVRETFLGTFFFGSKKMGSWRDKELLHLRRWVVKKKPKILGALHI